MLRSIFAPIVKVSDMAIHECGQFIVGSSPREALLFATRARIAWSLRWRLRSGRSAGGGFMISLPSLRRRVRGSGSGSGSGRGRRSFAASLHTTLSDSVRCSSHKRCSLMMFARTLSRDSVVLGRRGNVGVCEGKYSCSRYDASQEGHGTVTTGMIAVRSKQAER